MLHMRYGGYLSIQQGIFPLTDIRALTENGCIMWNLPSVFGPDQRPQRADPSQRLIRLLFAEDDAQLREFIVRVLSAAGFEVVTAADGEETLELYHAQGPFDVLLLDEDMPQRKGRSVLARIRATGDDIPAVLWSGDIDLEDSEIAALHIATVLHKPLGPTALISALRGAITTPELVA
jgi:CheY-like chemotaxis protein